jgi:hypothetical protein
MKQTQPNPFPAPTLEELHRTSVNLHMIAGDYSKVAHAHHRAEQAQKGAPSV